MLILVAGLEQGHASIDKTAKPAPGWAVIYMIPAAE